MRERRTEAAGDGTAEFATADVLSLHASLTPEMSRQAGAWALGLEGKLTPRRVEDDESRGALVARGRSPVAGLADAEAR